MTSRRLAPCFILFSALCLGAAAAERDRPNIVMIAIDDMNDWIGALGGPAITPHIDRLAAEGVLFNNAHCVVPACNPSRVAIMTGLRPETTGQYENAGNFRDRPRSAEALTLPQLLQRHGYTTAAAGKVFHHSRGKAAEPRPLSDPLSWTEQHPGNIGTGGGGAYLDANGMARWLRGNRRNIKNDYGLRSPLFGTTPENIAATGDWETATYGADFIARDHAQPYFLALGIFRPHAPLIAPQAFFDLYPFDEIVLPETPADDMDDIPAIAQENWSTPLFLAMKEEQMWRQGVQAYLAAMSYADACVGRILEAIEASPDRDNTIVVLWTDHGWQLGHKNRWEKFSLWRQATRTPLMIRASGIAPGESDRAVSLLDLFPTLSELTGVDAPAGLEGTSLVPLLQDPSAPRDEPAIVTYLPTNHAVFHEDWNYIRYSDGSEELYHRGTDPSEFTNLINQPTARAVADRLARWLPDTPAADVSANQRLGGVE